MNNNPALAKRERSLDYWCRKAVVGQRRVRVNTVSLGISLRGFRG
jgi:hypothetical protein